MAGTSCVGRSPRADGGLTRVTPAEVVVPAMAGSDTAPTLVSLHVIVRNLIAPGRAVEAADVRVRNASAAATAPVWAGPYLTTDAAGHVRRDSLRLATYDVAVRALGFSAFVT